MAAGFDYPRPVDVHPAMYRHSRMIVPAGSNLSQYKGFCCHVNAVLSRPALSLDRSVGGAREGFSNLQYVIR
jgi:hypothetical protein